MATLAANVLTLMDIAKTLDPDGKIAMIAELLQQTNAILMDIPWVESNLPTAHRYTQRTSLPTTTWRLFNQGVAPSKSTSTQAEDSIGMLEAWSEVDKDLAELNGNEAMTRIMEAKAFIESMGQELSQTIFYGNAGTAPEEFTGLTPRYNSLTGTTAQNVISAAGSGSDNSSIWLVGWDSDKVFGVYPKGTIAGLQHEDIGLDTAETSAAIGGNRLRVYRDRFQWKAGLALKDWRYAVRVCNIDQSNLSAMSSAADLQHHMIRAMHRIPSLGNCRPVYYMNRTCFEFLHIQGRIMEGALTPVATTGVLQTSGAGNINSRESSNIGPIHTFMGIPVRICDQLTQAEATVA